MKKVISVVLTAAMVVGMGVSALAATPSKTVADEVKASGSATVTGENGVNLNGSYAFSAQIYPQSLAQGNEFVLSAVYANNYQIRFALRGVDESHYLIFFITIILHYFFNSYMFSSTSWYYIYKSWTPSRSFTIW